MWGVVVLILIVVSIVVICSKRVGRTEEVHLPAIEKKPIHDTNPPSMVSVRYQQGRLMWNAQGSSYCRCFFDDEMDDRERRPWIVVWMDVTGKNFIGKCSFASCNNNATCGGHLQYTTSRQWYLAPICTSCNLIENDEKMRPLTEDTVLVKISCHCRKKLERAVRR